MSKIAPLPTVYCCKSKNRTYIRTYKNERVEGKSYPVKTNIKNIAEITNGDGVGRLIFTDEFLKENQHFIDRPVIRIFDESSQKYVFLYANIQEEKAAEFGEHQKVTSVRTVGMYYACRHYLSSDPLIFTLKDCFPKTWDKMLSLAMFCADEGDFRADHYSRYAKEHKLPYQETLTVLLLSNNDQNFLTNSVTRYPINFVHYILGSNIYKLSFDHIPTEKAA